MHLVEISTKSTKNMGYAQVTQSPRNFSPFLANFVHLTSSGFAHFSVGWWREQGQAGCGGEMFRKSSLLFSLFEGFP